MNEDIDSIMHALQAWFESQGVRPSDAASAMMALSGALLAQRANHVADLIEGLHTTQTLLTLNAFDHLNKLGKLVVRDM